ncbi:immunity-related GTPase family, q2 [Danio rerio]|uniref:Immunity-related GTPase family, q2 n=1 Tax=Danio rerio TaxID=7955 RepID=Q1LY91_DANRE|nr:immunity-related GTPase family, q2 [Danio rerio]AAI62755.1 Immunity-related GTPase family, q2 [Danio rerio]AAI62756.1 Immunity-related GTPase family, q2 [Danio rerio]|eukprot:NP_001038275.1 immunity-related GTPase family, q2 [Danio rerio]
MADVIKGLNLLETLKESIEKNNISDIRDALEDMLISRINIAIAGERNAEKATFINSLRGLSQEDEGAAQNPPSAAPEELAVFTNPKHPDFRLWDLPPISSDANFKPEDYIERFKATRYNAIILTSTDRPSANSVAVWKEVRSLQKETVYFVLLASVKDTEKSLEAKKAASLDVLKAEGVPLPKVFLVQPSALEKLDFLTFLEVMRGDLPEIRAHALLLALPTFSSSLVTQKKDAFKALVWAAASLSGGVSAIPVPLVSSMVDATVGVRILVKAQISLCLDDESLQRLARQRGLDPAKLKALRTCALSVEVSKSEVKRRLAEAEKDTSTATTRLVELAIPRQARSVSRSFTVMLQALNNAIDDMGADAEKVVAMVTGERQ